MLWLQCKEQKNQFSIKRSCTCKAGMFFIEELRQQILATGMAEIEFERRETVKTKSISWIFKIFEIQRMEKIEAFQ